MPSLSPSPPICGDGHVRNRLAGGAPDRDADRSRLSGLPAFLTPQPGPEFRFHDPAGHGGRAGIGEQAIGLSGERRFHSDLRQPGRPCLDGGAWRAPADGHGQRISAGVLGIELLAAVQGCDFHHGTSLQPDAWRMCAQSFARKRAHDAKTTAISSPTRGSQSAGAQWRRHRGRGAGRSAGDCRHERLAQCPARGSASHLSVSRTPEPSSRRTIEQKLAFALAGAQGHRLVGSTGFTNSRPTLTPRSFATEISRTVIDVNRDPGGTSLYPGQATTDALPDRHLRRRGALSDRAASPDTDEIARRRQHFFRSLSCHARVRRSIASAPASLHRTL